MPSPTPLPVSRKRQAAVDLLCACVQHSPLAAVVSVDTVRYVVESAISEMYREGEFRLEPLWSILSKEPGLTIAMSAAPLVAFKRMEQQANIRVRLPDAVAEIPAIVVEELPNQVKIPADQLGRLLAELRDADRDVQVAEYDGGPLGTRRTGGMAVAAPKNGASARRQTGTHPRAATPRTSAKVASAEPGRKKVLVAAGLLIVACAIYLLLG